jgi:hypothetical protein
MSTVHLHPKPNTSKVFPPDTGGCPVQWVADCFMAGHSVKMRSNGEYRGWHSTWVIDGEVMSTKQVRKMLVPLVMNKIGPDPKSLKRIIWKLISKINRT